MKKSALLNPGLQDLSDKEKREITGGGGFKEFIRQITRVFFSCISNTMASAFGG